MFYNSARTNRDPTLKELFDANDGLMLFIRWIFYWGEIIGVLSIFIVTIVLALVFAFCFVY